MEPSGKHFECQELRPEDASMTRSAGVVCTLEMERMLPAPEADDPQKGSELQAPRTEHPRGRNEDEVDGVVNRETPKQTGRPAYHKLAASSEVERLKNKIRQDIKAKNYEALQETDAKGATFLASLIDSRHANNDCYLVKLEMTLNGIKLNNGTPKSKLPDEIIKYLLTNEDKDGYSAMEKAAYLGKTEFLTLMAERYSELHDREPVSKRYPVSKKKNRTFLHSAASGGYLETCEFILNKWPEIIDEQDIDGFTALHIASAYKHDEVIVLLLQRKASLLLMNKIREPAFVYAMCSENAKELLLQRFNEAIRFKDTGPYSAKKDKIIFSLNSVIPVTASGNTDANRIVSTKGAESEPLLESQTGMTTKNKNVTTVRETEVLANLVKVKFDVAQDFLLHPLCQTFVELKMQRLRLFCILELLLYLFYVCLFTSLSICRGAVSTASFSNNATSENNITASSYNCSSDIFGLQISTTILAALKVITNFCLLIFCVKKYYTKENYKPEDKKISFPARSKRLKSKSIMPLLTATFRLLLHITTFVITWLLVESTKYITPFVLLLHWYWIIYKLEVFEYSGKYVMMLKTVLDRFFRLLLTFLPIYIGFALAFSAAFKDVALLQFPMMLMTGFSMMVGEHNSNDIFEKNHVDFTSSIVFIAFIVVLGIVVMNLLVGLTVADTTLLEKEGEARLVVQNLNRINIAEEITELIEKMRISFISKQLSLLPRSNGGNGSNRKSDHTLVPGEIELSLKECEKSDLLYVDKSEKSRHSWLRRQCEYYLFAICGVVLCNTSLYRKYPIHDKIQAAVEAAAVRTSKASKKMEND